MQSLSWSLVDGRLGNNLRVFHAHVAVHNSSNLLPRPKYSLLSKQVLRPHINAIWASSLVWQLCSNEVKTKLRVA